jgi:hypothetical protein
VRASAARSTPTIRTAGHSPSSGGRSPRPRWPGTARPNALPPTRHSSRVLSGRRWGRAKGPPVPGALNGYQWAVTLLARDAPGDRQRAAELAEETLAYCGGKGYTTFVTETEELLATIR